MVVTWGGLVVADSCDMPRMLLSAGLLRDGQRWRFRPGAGTPPLAIRSLDRLHSECGTGIVCGNHVRLEAVGNGGDSDLSSLLGTEGLIQLRYAGRCDQHQAAKMEL